MGYNLLNLSKVSFRGTHLNLNFWIIHTGHFFFDIIYYFFKHDVCLDDLYICLMQLLQGQQKVLQTTP